MVKYVKCPRCELNYIEEGKQQFCDVCIKEMKGLDDEDPFFQTEDEEEETELCPVCGENMMRAGEKMCDECKQKSVYEEEEDPEANLDNDEEWRSYLDNDSEAEEIELTGLDDDDIEEEEEEEEEPEEEEVDFEYVTGDDIYKYSEGFEDEDDEDDDGDFDDEDISPLSRSKRRSDDDF